MRRLAIIVEGETELDFSGRILKPRLTKCFSAVELICLRGGCISVDSLRKNILPLARSFDFVTTMVDYYRFEGARGTAIGAIEESIKASVEPHGHKVIPYLQQYEFETLLFADKDIVARHLDFDAAQRKKLNGIRQNPEEINHDHPPSRRLQEIYEEYQKRLNGVEIAEKIGLAAIMERCPRFARWVKKLESVSV